MHVLAGTRRARQRRASPSAAPSRQAYSVRARQAARHPLRVPGTVALPQPDGGGERPRHPSAPHAASAGGARPATLIVAKLDEIFPGHGIAAGDVVRRPVDRPAPDGRDGARLHGDATSRLRLVILDEPTSSLDAHTAGQLLAFMRRGVAAGHELHPDLAYAGRGPRRTADRIVVMRDGKVVVSRRGRRLRPRQAGRRHGRRAKPRRARPAPRPRPPRRRRPVRVARPRRRSSAAPNWWRMRARSSASPGLAGHGQTELLLGDLRGRDARRAPASRSPRRWRWWPATGRPTASSRNGRSPRTSASARSRSCGSGLLISPAARGASLPRAGSRRSASARPTSTTTSCRCRAATSRRRCSPARSARTREIVLMDDPMRGVDIGTKLEVYDLIRAGGARRPHLPLVHDRDRRTAATATTSMSSATARIVADLHARRTDRGEGHPVLVRGGGLR